MCKVISYCDESKGPKMRYGSWCVCMRVYDKWLLMVKTTMGPIHKRSIYRSTCCFRIEASFSATFRPTNRFWGKLSVFLINLRVLPSGERLIRNLPRWSTWAPYASFGNRLNRRPYVCRRYADESLNLHEYRLLDNVERADKLCFLWFTQCLR